MPHLPRRQFLRFASAALAAPAISRTARADTFPSHAVKFVVPFPAGGATDILARILSRYLPDHLGQQLIVENKPGGGTNIAVSSVVNAPPDGYTTIMTLGTNSINPWLYKSLPFNYLRDIAFVSGLAEQPLVWDLNPNVPAKTVAEFVAYCKANPGKVAFASFGARTVSHLSLELIKQQTGIEVVHVPYQGGAPMLTDLIAGRVQAGVDALPNSLQHIRSGAARGLAVLSKARAPTMPDVPTVAETYPGFEVASWVGVGVPTGTPPDVIATLNKAINAALAEPELKRRYADVGAQPMVISSAEAHRRFAADTEMWGKVVQQAGLKPE